MLLSRWWVRSGTSWSSNENQEREEGTRKKESGTPDVRSRSAPVRSTDTGPVSVGLRSRHSQHIIAIASPQQWQQSDKHPANGGNISDSESSWSKRRCGEHGGVVTSCGDSLVVVCGHTMSSVVTMSGNNHNSGPLKRNNFLRRSDSYRRAKNVMSPDVKQNRKSVEIVTVNNNSSLSSKNSGPANNFEGSAPGSKSSNTVTVITASSPTNPSPAQNGHANNSSKSEKPAAKNNFFKSLRSSFSFSSLRVKKSQARPSLTSLHISSPLEASSRDDSDLYQVIIFTFPATFCLQVHTEPYIMHHISHPEPRLVLT